MCLATAPRVLLLDEPLAGMAPKRLTRMLALLVALKASHAVLLVEHDMDAVFRIADRITVMGPTAKSSRRCARAHPQQPPSADRLPGRGCRRRCVDVMLQLDAINTYYGESTSCAASASSCRPARRSGCSAANGMGKTTLIRTLMGMCARRRGGSPGTPRRDKPSAERMARLRHRLRARGPRRLSEPVVRRDLVMAARPPQRRRGWTLSVCLRPSRAWPDVVATAASSSPAASSRCSRSAARC